MITGFNTDIEHEGVIYHVQTEDKGLETPLLLSLVYSGGAILASKRVPYDDLVASGFNEKVLAERLQRQHKLMCAAIRAGRIDELKLMSQREAVVRSARKAEQRAEREAERKEEPAPALSGEPAADAGRQSASAIEREPVTKSAVPVAAFNPPPPIPMRNSQPLIMMRPATESDFELGDQAEEEEELNLELVDDRNFNAGDVVALRIRVSRGAGAEDDGVTGAQVIVKILGTTFRPLICSAMTDRDGMAVVFTTLPRFTSGRAAILVRAVSGSREAEMRRIILPDRG